MRGGKRSGAGRKKTEQTVRLSVPVGLVDEVKQLIASYKQRQLLNNCQTIKQPIEQPADNSNNQKASHLKTSQKIKKPVESPRHDVPVKSAQDIQRIRALLERKAKAFEKKALIKVHGSLFNAARDGVQFDENGFLTVPSEFATAYQALGIEFTF